MDRPVAGASNIAVIHRAAWVVPVHIPPIMDGAVLTLDQRIAAVGSYTEISSKAPAEAAVMDYGPAALIPALVNGHTHLELTGLGGKVPLPQQSFGAWLKDLLPHRSSLTPEDRRRGIAAGRRLLWEAGTGLCADVMNGPCFGEEWEEAGSSPPEHLPERLAFLETLGFDRTDLASALSGEDLAAFNSLAGRSSALSLAAHACYSTSGELIQETKAWCRSHGRLFCIHVAEHPEEMEFLRNGTGFCREVLEALGRWVPTWGPPGTTPIRYLDRLGVLDEWTLLVHAVHVTEEDWDIIARRGCPVCFCPRSNLNLNGGQAAVERALQRSIEVVLGTDSLASNTDLSLFAEGALLLDRHPGLRPEVVLQMMTRGGAAALKQAGRFGILEPGRKSAMLAVQMARTPSSSELMEAVISQGRKGAWQWAIHRANR